MKQILVVEDDPSLRVVIRMVLERAGYEVIDARNGVDALDLVGREMPDLILADMKMPVMNGAELIGRIRTNPQTASVPIVLMSGMQDDPAVSRFANAVVAKPFEPAQLVAAIDRLLDTQPG